MQNNTNNDRTLKEMGSGSLISTPSNKRSRLSRRNKGHSPGNINVQSALSPIFVPVGSPLRRTPTHQQQARVCSMRSPLASSTKQVGSASTPNHNWPCSQEPTRDIMWDNTRSPVNAKGLKGLRQANGVDIVQIMCNSWGSGCHEGGSCPSQVSAPSDMWLSAKNDVSVSVPMYTRLQKFKANIVRNGVETKEQKGLQNLRKGVTSSEHMNTLMEILNHKVPGPINIQEASSESEDPVEEILAPNSDPTQKSLDTSMDDLWGEEDNTFQLVESQSFNVTNKMETQDVLTIPSTLPSHNKSDISSPTIDKKPVLKTNVNQDRRVWKNTEFNRDKCVKGQEGPTKHLPSHTFAMPTMPVQGRAPVNLAENNRKRLMIGHPRNNTQNKLQGPLLVRAQIQTVVGKQNSGVKGGSTEEIITLDDHKILATPSQAEVGMPGVWLSQASLYSFDDSFTEDVIVKPANGTNSGMVLRLRGNELGKNCDSSSNLRNRNVNKMQGLCQSKVVPTTCVLTGLRTGLPTIPLSVGQSPPKDDYDDNVDWDHDDKEVCWYSQENLQLLDQVAELEAKQTTEQPSSGSTTCPVQDIILDSAPKESLCHKQGSNETRIPIGSSQEGNCKENSQQENTYKRQCSRQEINRKKAEALRRRRLKEEARNIASGTLSRSGTVRNIT